MSAIKSRWWIRKQHRYEKERKLRSFDVASERHYVDKHHGGKYVSKIKRLEYMR